MTIQEMLANASTATGRKSEAQTWVEQESDGVFTLWLVTLAAGTYKRPAERRIKSYARHHGNRACNIKADDSVANRYWVVTVKRAANDSGDEDND